MHKVIKYHYLKRKTLLNLIITLVLISAAFSITIEGVLIFINAGLGYLGPGNVIYDTKSSTIFSGSVNLAGLNNLSLGGNIDLAPEVIIPIYIGDKYALCRGVDFSKLRKYDIYSISVVNGDFPKYDDEVLIGCKLANSLNIDVGDVIVIRSIIRNCYVVTKISGVYQSNSPLDYEVLSTLKLGQFLRGFDENHVTLVRIYRVEKEALEESTGGVISRPSGEEVKQIEHVINETLGYGAAVADNKELFSIYMRKFGFNGFSILVFVFITLAFTLLGLYYATITLIEENFDIINQLYMLGAKIRSIKVDLILKVIPYIVVLTILSYLISHKLLLYLWSNLQIQYILHAYDVGINLYSLLATLILILLIFITAIWRGVKLE